MPIHSSILVHWTGSDIEESSVENKAQRYVERLADDCENGLFSRNAQRKLSFGTGKSSIC